MDRMVRQPLDEVRDTRGWGWQLGAGVSLGGCAYGLLLPSCPLHGSVSFQTLAH
jgi:hypothetical protein